MSRKSITTMDRPEIALADHAGSAKSFAKWTVQLLLVFGFAIAAFILWHADLRDALSFPPNSFSPVLDIGVLVFREGLECLLVLAAITGGLKRGPSSSQKPIALGVGAGFVATLVTWFLAVRVLDDLSQRMSALALQAATGLLAVVVLLIVMNWFFHKLYWTGWISFHSQRKRKLLEDAGAQRTSQLGMLWGMGMLGFTSFYREGVEVVLFLQSYRLRLGGEIVLGGACLGILLSGIVAVLTLVAHRKLPYRKMLVLTGTLLGIVLIVMVGEQAQEMQLAHWISTTTIPALAAIIPSWMGLWLSIFPTTETLLAQAAAAALVLGSYVAASRRTPSRHDSLKSNPEVAS
jgi:high-affinity iron transporter